MGLEGKIFADLRFHGAEPGTEVTLTSTRPLDLARCFVGMKTSEAVATVPLLFSICGGAQASAAVSACETAAGGDGGGRAQARALIVAAESAREHILRILLDWRPDGDDRTPHPGLPAVMRLRERMQAALFGEALPFALYAESRIDRPAVNDTIAALDDILAQHILGEAPETWLAREDRAAFEAWFETTTTPAAAFFAELFGRQWQAVGRADPRFLPDLDSGELWRRLLDDDGGSFTSRPEWNGKPCETGALARARAHPLIGDLLAAYGAGIVTRHAARLVELAGIPAVMRRALTDVISATSVTAHGGDGAMAQVETARGRLIHAVRLDDELIAAYKILAPTEWNFHADGAAATALRGLTAGDPAAIKAQAGEVIRAVDPCVDFEVRIG